MSLRTKRRHRPLHSIAPIFRAERKYYEALKREACEDDHSIVTTSCSHQDDDDDDGDDSGEQQDVIFCASSPFVDRANASNTRSTTRTPEPRDSDDDSGLVSPVTPSTVAVAVAGSSRRAQQQRQDGGYGDWELLSSTELVVRDDDDSFSMASLWSSSTTTSSSSGSVIVWSYADALKFGRPTTTMNDNTRHHVPLLLHDTNKGRQQGLHVFPVVSPLVKQGETEADHHDHDDDDDDSISTISSDDDFSWGGIDPLETMEFDSAHDCYDPTGGRGGKAKFLFHNKGNNNNQRRRTATTTSKGRKNGGCGDYFCKNSNPQRGNHRKNRYDKCHREGYRLKKHDRRWRG